MRNTPTVFKVIVNILLYVFYVLVASVAFSFIFPLVLQVFGKEILDGNDPIFAKIQIFIALLVLIVSVILRKYFYTELSGEKEVVMKKTVQKDEDGLKIQIEKEIK